MVNAFRQRLLDMVGFTDYIATFADAGRPIMAIEPYTYSVDGQVLAAPITFTAPQIFDTPMDGDSDFVMTAMAGFGRAAGAQILIVNPAIMIQITDLTASRTFFNAPMPMPFVAGQGGFPYLPTGPRVVRARSKLRISAQSAQAQSFSGFFFAYHGARIWYGG